MKKYKISNKLGWKFELTLEEIHIDELIQYNMEKDQIVKETNEKTNEEIQR